MFSKQLAAAQPGRALVLWATSIALLALGTACTQSGAAKPVFSGPCAIALAAHQGEALLDREIRQTQQHIRQAPNPRPNLEKLGWKYIEKARLSYDPGFYKLAEQCAACMETYAPLSPAETQRLKNADALLLRGHILHNLHRFQEAEPLARQLSTQRGLAFDHALLGDVLLEQGQLDEAAVVYQKMMDLKPGSQAYIRAAQLRWLKGDLEGAIEMALAAVRASSPNEPESAAWVTTKLALYSLQAGLLPQAEAAAEAALKQLPGYAPALLARGRVWLAQGKTEAAVSTLVQAVKLNPLPEYQWTLAEALRAAGRFAEAAEHEALLKTHAPSEDPRTLALYLATREEALPQALQLAQAELQQRRDPHTLDALAWAQARAGRSVEAWQTMQQALASGTADARLFLHAALIAQQLNDSREAQRRFKQAQAGRSALLPSEQTLLRQLNF